MEIEAVRTPVVLGVNPSDIVQVVPAAITVPQLLLAEKSADPGPASAMFPMFKAVGLLLETTTPLILPFVAMSCGPKPTAPELKESAATADEGTYCGCTDTELVRFRDKLLEVPRTFPAPSTQSLNTRDPYTGSA